MICKCTNQHLRSNGIHTQIRSRDDSKEKFLKIIRLMGRPLTAAHDTPPPSLRSNGTNGTTVHNVTQDMARKLNCIGTPSTEKPFWMRSDPIHTFNNLQILFTIFRHIRSLQE